MGGVEVGVLFVVIVLPLMVIGGFVLLLVWLLSSRGPSKAQRAEELRILEQIWGKLDKMERRIGNVETIVLDSTQKPRDPSQSPPLP